MTPIITFLAERLSEIDDRFLVSFARTGNVDPGNARRARAGQPISARDSLALLAARGYDPVTRKLVPSFALGQFDHLSLAMGLRMRMRMNQHTFRQAATAMRTSATAVVHMYYGRVLGIENTLKACAYVGVHPFEQCERRREAA